MDIREQARILRLNTSSIVPESGLEEKLKLKRPLVVKLGLDPTTPDIHLGHVVVLRKLRQFQDLGHKVVLIIGDFTAQIGDPSGRSQTRPLLTDKEIKNNAATYKKQATKILDSSSKKLSIRFNSAWLEKMKPRDIVRLMATTTISQLLAREDFKKRLKSSTEVFSHEILYPLFQAQDSVAIAADVEIGGTDQTFNLLMGRELQKSLSQSQQLVVTMPLIAGLDGVAKMSKSLGNFIGVTEAPEAIFGKVMSIPDTLLESYAELVAGLTWAELKQLPPIDAKKRIAEKIVAMCHGAGKAQLAQKTFESTFQKREFPVDAQILKLSCETSFIDFVIDHNLFPSKSEARRKIAEGAVELNGKKITDPFTKISLPKGDSLQLKIGKKGFYRIQ